MIKNVKPCKKKKKKRNQCDWSVIIYKNGIVDTKFVFLLMFIFYYYYFFYTAKFVSFHSSTQYIFNLMHRINFYTYYIGTSIWYVWLLISFIGLYIVYARYSDIPDHRHIPHYLKSGRRILFPKTPPTYNIYYIRYDTKIHVKSLY